MCTALIEPRTTLRRRGVAELARLGAALLFVSAFARAVPALADAPATLVKTPAKILCETFDPTAGTGDAVTETDVLGKAAFARRVLEETPQGTPRVSADDLALASTAIPSPTARADYCLEIGELVRRGAFDNPLDAPGYLRVAFRYAELAGDKPRSARAAFRLGLAFAALPAGSGGRGVRAGGGLDLVTTVADVDDDNQETAQATDARSIGPPSPGSLMLKAAGSEDACGRLADQNVLVYSLDPVVALRCSAVRGDPRQSAQAILKLARLLLAQAAADKRLAAPLRTKVIDIAGGLLVSAGADPMPELSVRLTEAVLDATTTADGLSPALLQNIERLEATAPLNGDDPGAAAAAAALHGRIVALTDCGLLLNTALASAMPSGAAQAGCPAALPYLERAVQLESRRSIPDRMGDWYMLMARADPARADAHVASAYSALEAVRASLPLRDPLTEESIFQIRERGVFEARIGSLLRREPDDAPLAPKRRLGLVEQGAARLATAQNILENFRQAEVSDALGNECVTAPVRVRADQLREGELILYPVLLPDRVELIYERGGRDGRFEQLPLSELAKTNNRETVAALVGALRQALTSNDPRIRKTWRAPAKSLYRLLIKPLDDRGMLKGDGTLVIIPDATLAALPFAALIADDDQYLIEKTRLAIAPSLAYAQPGVDHAGKDAYVVAGSLDEAVSLGFGLTFPKLANAGLEAKLAAGYVDADSKHYSGLQQNWSWKTAGANGRAKQDLPQGVTQPKPGLYLSNFTVDELRNVLTSSSVDILHLATHASFSGGSDKSFVVANGGFITLRELSQLISDSKARGRQLDLLVLSACETALGDDNASLGLAGAAVQSGARGAIASLWEINDFYTRKLMVDFYTQYRLGKSKAEALRFAERDVMSHKRNDPNLWASLILVGGWR